MPTLKPLAGREEEQRVSHRALRTWTMTLRQARRQWLLLCSLLLPLLVYPGNTSYPATKAAFASVAIALLVLLWAGELALSPTARLGLPPLVRPWAALALLAAVSTAGGPATGWLAWLWLLGFGALYWSVAEAVERPRQAVALVDSLVGAGAVVAVYALAQALGWLAGPAGVDGPAAMIATLGNPNYVAAFLVPLIPPAFALRRSGRRRVLGPAGVALFLATVVLTGSRAALLALAVAVTFLFLGHRRGWGPVLTTWGLGITALGLASGWFAGLLPQLGTTEGGRSLVERLFAWQVAWQIFRDHPWTGVGLEGYARLFLEYKARILQEVGVQNVPFYLPRAVQAHNEFLQLAAEVGLGGLAVLAWGLGRFWKAWQRELQAAHRHPSAQRLRLGLAAGILGGGCIALFDFPLHRPGSAWVLVVLAGALHARGLSRAGGRGRRLSRAARLFLIVPVALSLVVIALTYREFQADLHLQAGRSALATGRLESAEAHLLRSRALSLAPYEALFHLAKIYYEQENYSRAIEALKESLQGRVSEAAELLLSQALFHAGRFAEAEAALERLLAGEPHPVHKLPAYFLRAQLYRQRGELELALAQLEHVLAARPDWVEVYLLQARIYREQGRPAQARERLRTGLAVAEELLIRDRELLRRELEQEQVPVAVWTALSRRIERLQEHILELRSELETLGD